MFHLFYLAIVVSLAVQWMGLEALCALSICLCVHVSTSSWLFIHRYYQPTSHHFTAIAQVNLR